MKSYLHISAPALLLIILAGAGCAVKIVSVGVAPDKVDQIEIGTDRATVEDLVDGVESEMSCTSGAKVDYVYDRGLKPVDNPALGAAAVLFVDALTFGYAELTVGLCSAPCQQGLLEIIYDSDGKVVAANPKPRSYDAGFFCDRGKSRYLCDEIRSDATETDLARRLLGGEEEVRATGCSPSYAGFAQTPRKTPAELKALADEGDAKASYEYALRVNDSAEAWKFHCLAANQNHPDAQGLVADHYRQGRDPVERDLLRAYVWYLLAELNGYEGCRRRSQQIKTETGWKCCTAKPAKPYSEVLADNMTPSELADGERLVSKWKPNPAECEGEAKLAAD